ncbi:MAG: hypothetical protein H7Z43_06050 [Clostridia bacterium]|nr:hypothetical protein [Deltaproteobacteria bacterium]
MTSALEGTKVDWGQFSGLCLLGFVQMTGYAIARPATESLFLEHCGANALPKVWLAVAFTALAVTTIYNRYASSIDLGRLFSAVAWISLGLLVVLILVAPYAPTPAGFALYVWKDVYIVVLVEVFWTFANAVYRLDTARWIYGLFLASGAVGGLVGNFGVGPLARRIGTLHALWLVVPVLAFTGVASFFAMRGVVRTNGRAPSRFGAGFARVAKNRYLLLIMALIGVVQLVLTLIDYQFNAALAASYPDVDVRTQVTGTIYGYISIFELCLQLSSGLVLRYAGVTAALIGTPLILGVTLLVAFVKPVFATIASAKIASKALDYSVMRAAKELLYIPLPYADKTQGKAVVDVLTYRTAKGGASLLLLLLQGLHSVTILPIIAALMIAWLVTAASLAKRFRALVRNPPGNPTDN